MLEVTYKPSCCPNVFLQQTEQVFGLIKRATQLRSQWVGSPGVPSRFLALRDKDSLIYGQNMDQLAYFESYVCQHGIETIVHLGIGGSILGPELLYEALSSLYSPLLKIVFISSFDPKLEKLLEVIDLNKTVFLIVSKSFETDEVLWQWSLVQSYFNKAKILGYAFAVTSSAEKAEKAGFAAEHILKIPTDVGGRFSVWSVVSASVVAAFGKDKFVEFLAGANLVDQQSFKDDVLSNISLAMALQAYDCLQNKKLPTRAICIYHAALEKFVAYLQQLEMESLGKHIGLDGKDIEGLTCPVVWGGTGTQMQHSVFQYLMQNGLKTPIDFIVVQGKDESAQKYYSHYQAQLVILKQGYQAQNREDSIEPNAYFHSLEIKGLTPKTLGLLLALYEHKILWLSGLLNINPFTQPGVQAAKEQLQKNMGNKSCSL